MNKTNACFKTDLIHISVQGQDPNASLYVRG